MSRGHGAFSVSGTTTYYGAGSFPVAVTVTITDGGGATATATRAATIDWGDGGAPTAGTVGAGAVHGSHTYAEAGTYAVNVTLTDAGGYTTLAASTANVADAALTAGAVSVTGATEGHSFTGIVASFGDADAHASAADFKASIRWGDGQVTAGTVGGGNGAFTVSGTKTYYATGSFPVAVAVTDADGAAVTISGTAVVADAALTGTAAALDATAGDALNGVTVATFTDVYADGSAADDTATIAWGDGTTSAGVVRGSDGTYGVSGSHTYAAQGFYALTVTLADAGGSASVTSSAQVSPQPSYVVANFTYYDSTNPAYAPPASQFAATIAWGDGTSPTTGVVSSTGSSGGYGGSYTISAPHAYAEEGSYNVVVLAAKQGDPWTQIVSGATVGAAAAMAAAAPQAPAAGPVIDIQDASFVTSEVVTSDDGKTTYNNPDFESWRKDTQDPLVVVAGHKLVLSSLDFIVTNGHHLIGQGPIEAVGTVDAGEGTLKGMTLTVPLAYDGKRLVLLNQNAPVQANIPFDVTMQGFMYIEWVVSLPDGQQIYAGATANQLYVPYQEEWVAKDGQPKPLYETVLKTGCIYNDGKCDSPHSVFDNAWAQFESRKIERAGKGVLDDDRFLSYYKSYKIGTVANAIKIAATTCTA